MKPADNIQLGIKLFTLLVGHRPRIGGEGKMNWPIFITMGDDGRLNFDEEQTIVQTLSAHLCPGNVASATLEFDNVRAHFTSIGERSISAEQVAETLVQQIGRYLSSDAPVCPHLADQLLLPLALCGGGVFRTSRVTLHTRTNAELITSMLPVSITMDEDAENAATITVNTGD